MATDFNLAAATLNQLKLDVNRAPNLLVSNVILKRQSRLELVEVVNSESEHLDIARRGGRRGGEDGKKSPLATRGEDRYNRKG